MKIFKYLLLFTMISQLAWAQNELNEKTHKVLGASVQGYEVNIPFSEKIVKAAWENYAKAFGRNESAADHMTYQTIFKPSIYPKEILFFAQIKGDKVSSTLWGGIDPQGVPKDTLLLLQKELKSFVYDFNIKVRTTAAQQKIDDSEQAASFLSKEFESLKRDERKNQKNLERANEKIIIYEKELLELRTDSSTYTQNLSQLSIKLDSLNRELEKVKGMVELYQQQMEGIE